MMMEYVVEQFNKLHQVDSLEGYIDQFQDLRSALLQNDHVLSAQYILESFIGGLKEDVKPFVRAFKPKSISEAIRYARLQESQLKANTSKTSLKPFSQPTIKAQQKDHQTNYHKPPLLPTPQPKYTTKHTQKSLPHIPADVRAQKIAQGLCYYCDEKFDINHKCKFKEPQLFTVEIGHYEEDQVLQEIKKC